MSPENVYSIEWALPVFQAFQRRYARATEEVLKEGEFTTSGVIRALCSEQAVWERFKHQVKLRAALNHSRHSRLAQEHRDVQELFPLV